MARAQPRKTLSVDTNRIMLNLKEMDDEFLLFRLREPFSGLPLAEVLEDYEHTTELVDQILRWRLAGDSRGWKWNEFPLAKFFVKNYGINNETNFPCPVCHKEFASMEPETEVFRPCHKCQKEGWLTVRISRLKRWLLRNNIPGRLN